MTDVFDPNRDRIQPNPSPKGPKVVPDTTGNSSMDFDPSRDRIQPDVVPPGPKEVPDTTGNSDTPTGS